MKDEKIINSISQGKGDVMQDVITQYSRLLWPIASAVLMNVGSELDVEECVADAFIYLWQYPQKFDPARGTLKNYLCLVVRSRAIDRYRQIIRQGELPLEEAVLSVSSGLQEELMTRETKQELIAAVNALGEPGREILVRRYYFDQKPRQIALALGMTVKQVDNSLYRSKRFLRGILSGREGLR